MSLAEFLSSPWSKSHTAYQASALSIAPAPEYANAEVLLAGLYRTIGLPGVMERDVPGNGRQLDKVITKARDGGRPPPDAALDGESAQALINGVLQSPKLQNQSAKRFIQVTPLVGETAWFSGSARLAGNPWRAGALLRRMVWLGSETAERASATWEALFEALSVTDGDDVFARFLSRELAAWTGHRFSSSAEMPAGGEVLLLPPGELDGKPFPARTFAGDLKAVVAAKPLMTRRQWTSMLEALVRIAAFAHVAWLCEVQRRAWDILRRALSGGTDPAPLRDQLYPSSLAFLTFGMGAQAELKDRTSAYLRARLGINTVLWSLADAGIPFEGTLGSSSELEQLRDLVVKNAGKLGAVLDHVDDLLESEARTLLCSKGIGSNLKEFALHVLYQRIPGDTLLRGYDKGFVLHRKGAGRTGRWICAPGPLALLTLVHCSLAGVAGPRSVQRLAQHMAAYGISVNHRDIARNVLGHQLRMLGLVLDSPDAETGMLLVAPFDAADEAST
ncbi:hypothetical protein [Bradyrhizobium sp. SZCCHNS3002]|uniref:hypothetical protein n=1 Tax=Bradyrhizobium sp. SZCCHNS3002 TaxID=3057310 RepID=UPI0028E798A9|nr:hypothetical protein [Bradyrhizobium sp. SZCCHNS3002]